MGAVTYAKKQVEQYIQQYFVPVQFNIVEQPEAMERFISAWTPSTMGLDAERKEHRRTQGYLDSNRMIGELALARVKAAIDRQKFAGAKDRIPATLRQTTADPLREPEALYWSAVANYKTSHDSTELLSGWNNLLDRFPESEWAKRAEFIRQ